MSRVLRFLERSRRFPLLHPHISHPVLFAVGSPPVVVEMTDPFFNVKTAPGSVVSVSLANADNCAVTCRRPRFRAGPSLG